MMRFVQGRAAGEAAGGRVVAGAAVYRLWAALADEHDGDGAKKRLFWNDFVCKRSVHSDRLGAKIGKVDGKSRHVQGAGTMIPTNLGQIAGQKQPVLFLPWVPFDTQNRSFTKTGSGQTWGKHHVTKTGSGQT